MPRTPEYDRADVVDKAMTVFWERGYGKTSVTDLVAATGLKPGSLYAAFGSKKGVFLEVLDCYNRGFVERVRGYADSRSSKIDAIRELFAEIVDDAGKNLDRRGCLSVNSLLEMAQHDTDIANHLESHNRQVRDAFAALIRAAQRDAELPADSNADALAAFLVNNVWGMRVSCKGSLDAAGRRAIVAGVLAGLKA